jgi:phosphatidylinositol-3-phosphatase
LIALLGLCCLAGGPDQHDALPVQSSLLRATPYTTYSTTHHINTVFIILMENHNWSVIQGSTLAPYINNALLPIAAHADHYYNPPTIHPSLPNYLWLEAGRNFSIWNDDAPSVNSQTTTDHLVTRLTSLGISWKAYAEGITGTECPLASSGYYAVNHNPFVYFDDVTENQNIDSPSCISHIRPFSQLAADLKGGTVAHYNFIIPNLCDDMHQSCSTNPILQGDTWLSLQLPVILSSAAYLQGGAVFITWDESISTEEAETVADEGEPADQPIGMIVLSPYGKRGYTSWIWYNHGSTLRTMEEIFGIVPTLPRDITHDADLSDLFATFP